MINVVFPVLNEELRLEKGIQTVVPFLSEHWMGNFQITIGSTHSTLKIVNIMVKIQPCFAFLTLLITAAPPYVWSDSSVQVQLLLPE